MSPLPNLGYGLGLSEKLLVDIHVLKEAKSVAACARLNAILSKSIALVLRPVDNTQNDGPSVI